MYPPLDDVPATYVPEGEVNVDTIETVTPDTDRRSRIDRLLEDSIRSFDTEINVAAANVLALLEIADAIDRLAAEVEKSGWSKK